MTVIEQIVNGIHAGKADYEQMRKDTFNNDQDEPHLTSELALGDNAEYMRHLLSRGYEGRFSLIYIDPPFFTRSKFNATVSVRDKQGAKHRIRHLAFDDRFERSLECYIENLTVRLLMMKDLLANDGLMWVHLDWHSSHYVRIVLDEIMGEKNFVNEIVWCYKSGGSGKKHFSRKHDTILVYSKSSKYYIDIPAEKSYNRGFKPYNFKGVKEYSDDMGWYTLVNMKDVWNVDMVGRTSAERNGYATQKPMELMKRIIRAGSREGDLVGDFFCGSGSFLEAAEVLGRKWIGCDNEKLAVSMARKRMTHQKAVYHFTRSEKHSIHGRVTATIADKELLENGKTLYKCSVKEFSPEIDTGYIQKNDRVYIEEVLKDDVMQLMDYILIYRAGRDDLIQITETGFDQITIISDHVPDMIAVDVFGREYAVDLIDKE